MFGDWFVSTFIDQRRRAWKEFLESAPTQVAGTFEELPRLGPPRLRPVWDDDVQWGFKDDHTIWMTMIVINPARGEEGLELEVRGQIGALELKWRRLGEGWIRTFGEWFCGLCALLFGVGSSGLFVASFFVEEEGRFAAGLAAWLAWCYFAAGSWRNRQSLKRWLASRDEMLRALGASDGTKG